MCETYASWVLLALSRKDAEGSISCDHITKMSSIYLKYAVGGKLNEERNVLST